MPRPSIAVLGGGVLGITNALALALMGARVTVYTRHRADTDQGRHRPLMASLYPAASVIPHRVTVDDVVAHMRDSQACFEVLRRSGTCGVRLQRHYEVFETPPNGPPDYAEAMHGFSMLPADGSGTPHVPRRPGVEAVFGWRFRTYVADPPTYLPRLFHLFEQLGGEITQRTLTRDALDDLSEDVLVNALGAGSRAVFPDDRPATFLRGCLVYADAPPTGRMPGPTPLASYNYTPTSDVYPTHDGTPGTLYVYPRLDAWVLGGSARPGRITPDGEWSGQPIAGPTRTVDGQTVPASVVETNAAILQQWTGHDVLSGRLRATFGVRYVRDPEDEGVCLRSEVINGRRVIHCHGHGGAGVTLSWSSACRVLRLLFQNNRVTNAFSPPSSSPSESEDVLLQHLFAVIQRCIGQ